MTSGVVLRSSKRLPRSFRDLGRGLDSTLCRAIPSTNWNCRTRFSRSESRRPPRHVCSMSRRTTVRFLSSSLQLSARIPLRMLAYCVMPNHFHLVVWPTQDDELSEFMQWFTRHAQQALARASRHQRDWFRLPGPIQSVSSPDRCALPGRLSVRRAESALRAGLVDRAEDWPWSSLATRCKNCHYRRA